MNLQTLRRNGQKYFAAHGFPTRKEEEWKYTSVKLIQEKQFKPALLDREDKVSAQTLAQIKKLLNKNFINLVYYNGAFLAEASNLNELKSRAEVFSIEKSQAVLSKIKAERQKITSLRQDSFEALNSSYLQDGVAIEIKKDQSLAKPVCLFYYNDQSQKSVYPKSFIVLNKGSKLTLLQEFCGQKDYFIDPVTEFLIEDSAKLEFYNIQKDSAEACHISCHRFLMKKNSNIDLLSLSLGSRLSRHNLDVHFLEEGAHATVNGMYLAGKDQHIDHHTYIDHQVGKCQSSQLYKGLLNDNARAVFDGKVFIQKQAQQANSEQLNKNLLLSSEAEVDSKPQLQIYADDVKATHGSTVGQLDEEEVFYLLSRAIPREQALEMLSLGFVRDLVDRIENEVVKAHIDAGLTAAYQLIKGERSGRK